MEVEGEGGGIFDSNAKEGKECEGEMVEKILCRDFFFHYIQ